jgi:hypothetical protein
LLWSAAARAAAFKFGCERKQRAPFFRTVVETPLSNTRTRKTPCAPFLPREFESGGLAAALHSTFQD